MLCTLIGAIILSINIQVGLNMHLYDDIGDASSSLRGSPSSFAIVVGLCSSFAIVAPIVTQFVSLPQSLVLANYDVRVATAEEQSYGRHVFLELVAPGKRTHTVKAKGFCE